MDALNILNMGKRPDKIETLPTITLTKQPDGNMTIDTVDGHLIRQVDVESSIPRIYRQLHADSCANKRGRTNG